MKLAEIKKYEGQALTTKRSKYGFGGQDIIILEAGGWVPSSRSSNHRRARDYDANRSGVAVARRSGSRWVADVLQPQQIENLTPEALRAVKEAEDQARQDRHESQKIEWEKTEAQIERISDRLAAATGTTRYLSKYDRGVTLRYDEIEALLDQIGV